MEDERDGNIFISRHSDGDLENFYSIGSPAVNFSDTLHWIFDIPGRERKYEKERKKEHKKKEKRNKRK